MSSEASSLAPSPALPELNPSALPTVNATKATCGPSTAASVTDGIPVATQAPVTLPAGANDGAADTLPDVTTVPTDKPVAPTTEETGTVTQARTSTDATPDAPAVTAVDNDTPASPQTTVAPAATEDQTTEPVVPPAPSADDTVSLNLTICDFAGKAISGLKYRIVVAKTIYAGSTNSAGQIDEISGLQPNQPLEFFVLKSDGQYASKFSGLVACADMNVCAVSPHIKISLETEAHKGTEGPAVPKPPKPEANQSPAAPLAGKIAGGGKQPDATTEACRNEAGHPVATLKEKAFDWARRNHIPTFGLWSWGDFKAEPKTCTVPAIQADKAKTTPANTAVTPSAKKPGAATAPAAAPVPTLAPSSTPASSAIGGVKVGSADQAAPPQVTHLVEIMEEQTAWEWKAMFSKPTSLSSALIKVGILANTFVPLVGKSRTKSDGRCYPSVKVGLWRAGLVRGYDVDVPAKGAGKWLLEQGFQEISKSIPDARWAMPGDIVVYRYSDEYEKANTDKHAAALKAYAVAKAKYDAEVAALPAKVSLWDDENKKIQEEMAAAKKNKHALRKPGKHVKPSAGTPPPVPDDENYGHIEVRTYDGYISDYKSEKLGDLLNSKPMVVLGVYRKVFDPLPDLRVRAFLKVLREWECHGIKDEDRYFRLQQSINGKITFSDTSTHPRAASGGEHTFAGAYQIALGTWKGQVKKGLPADFSPATQDRMAVSIIEGRSGNPLGKIRQGKIEDAVKLLPKEWSSLPGGVDARHETRAKQNYVYTMADLLDRYNVFLNELIGK
ncbi:hypothetical protein [Rugamonas aquatica]|uniref:Muramidase (Phage lambda lysozyme) n=1 Tax=Rugamonas aquatica TaxID=2743357 RepID=A0A6A7NA94_9BURK|nr:hypothetical protein [Rugamonas aquatica]MQA41996.1 hypothetical protein [Rugamonas aquatica]